MATKNQQQTKPAEEKPAAQKVVATQVKKITVAGIHGPVDVKKVLNSDEPLSVMRVYGNAVSHKTVPTPFGESICLLGQFEAIGTETGLVQQAAQLYLPEVALIPLVAAMTADEGKIRAVVFAIELFVWQAQNKKPGGSVYEYTFKPLMPPDEADPMEQLRRRVNEVAPALPAPTRAPESVKRSPGRPPKS